MSSWEIVTTNRVQRLYMNTEWEQNPDSQTSNPTKVVREVPRPPKEVVPRSQPTMPCPVFDLLWNLLPKKPWALSSPEAPEEADHILLSPCSTPKPHPQTGRAMIQGPQTCSRAV